MTYLAVFPSWRNVLVILPFESRWNVIDALLKYATEGIDPTNLTNLEHMAFISCKTDVDNSMNRYNDRVEKNRRNGRKGGLAKAAKMRDTEGHSV